MCENLRRKIPIFRLYQTRLLPVRVKISAGKSPYFVFTRHAFFRFSEKSKSTDCSLLREREIFFSLRAKKRLLSTRSPSARFSVQKHEYCPDSSSICPEKAISKLSSDNPLPIRTHTFIILSVFLYMNFLRSLRSSAPQKRCRLTFKHQRVVTCEKKLLRRRVPVIFYPLRPKNL